jgi:putative nucleotidyltransferase with HDIG domain
VNEVEKENAEFTQALMSEVQQKTAQLTDALKLLTQAYDDTLEALGSALSVKDEDTGAHSQRVTAYAISIAKSVPVPLPYLTVLARAAFLHDIGKMAIPDKILRKAGPLDDAERVIMRTHCEIGYNMVTRIPFLRESADGSGYPRGLRGERIPLGARIISIANALDAMLNDWPYRNALPMSYAREEIRRCAGTQFDPKIVEVFLSIPESHFVELRENLGSPFLTGLRNMAH